MAERPRGNRRTFLKQSALLALAMGIRDTRSAVKSQDHSEGLSADLVFRSASDLARLIRSKALSSEEVVRAHLERIDRVNPKVNAVCRLDAEGALHAARAADAAIARGTAVGPLHGVPVTIKDSFDTAGIISTGGTTGRSSYVPAEDATAVARLRRAGAIILGKTNTPELTLSYETDNLLFGRTNNPWDLSRTPGGSSGGAAAILALGGSPLDIGSDTAGSIRVPAAFCGIAGLKPSFGLISRAGHILPPGGVVGRRTHVGPMARSIEDLALLLPILAGTDPRDSDTIPVELGRAADVQLESLRLAFFTTNGRASTAPEIVQAIRSAVGVLTQSGAVASERCIPGFDQGDAILQVLNLGDGGDYYRKLLRQCGTTRLSPQVERFLERARAGVVSGRKYSDTLLDWARLRESALAFMKDFDLLICPACSGTAPKHGGTIHLEFSYCYFFNLLGWPAAVLRVGKSPDGLPVGVQIVGRPWQDHQVLAAAFRLEQALGGWKPDFLDPARLVQQAGE